MKTIICSDAHLKVTPEGASTLNDFVAFLNAIDAERFDRLLILGDLFDFWFEYRHVIFGGYFEVLRAFADLRDRGVELHLVCGNHDFWSGRFLEEQLGVTVHHDEFRCTSGEQRVLFVHGDGVDRKDYGYRLFKYVARSRVAVALFRLLHPDWAMAIARRISAASRSVQSGAEPGKDRPARAIERFVHEVLESGEVDVVVCGHSHYATRVELETPNGTGLYVNSGNWLHDRDYVEWDGQEFQLKRFSG